MAELNVPAPSGRLVPPLSERSDTSYRQARGENPRVWLVWACACRRFILTIANDSAHRMGAKALRQLDMSAHNAQDLCSCPECFSSSTTVWRLLPPCGQMTPLQGPHKFNLGVQYLPLQTCLMGGIRTFRGVLSQVWCGNIFDFFCHQEIFTGLLLRSLTLTGLSP